MGRNVSDGRRMVITLMATATSIPVDPGPAPSWTRSVLDPLRPRPRSVPSLGFCFCICEISTRSIRSGDSGGICEKGRHLRMAALRHGRAG